MNGSMWKGADRAQMFLFTWQMVGGKYVYFSRSEANEDPQYLWWHIPKFCATLSP